MHRLRIYLNNLFFWNLIVQNKQNIKFKGTQLTQEWHVIDEVITAHAHYEGENYWEYVKRAFLERRKYVEK